MSDTEAAMSESLAVTLTGAAAKAVLNLVARGHYGTAEEAVVDAVGLLAEETEPGALSPEWLAEASRRMAEHDADPPSAITIPELKQRLALRLGRELD
jgi:putative addiction module component (TIGR02574 family)